MTMICTKFVSAALLPIVVSLLIPACSAIAAVLTHGPVVGSVTGSDAKVFVRTDQAALVRIQYGTDPDLVGSLTTGAFQTLPAADFTGIVRLLDLSPSTTYYLNILVSQVAQLSAPYPSFKTFPATADPQSFKFIVLTDFMTRFLVTEAVPTFSTASSEGAEFVFIGGDFDHRDPGTLADKRLMFKQLYDPNSLGLSDFVNNILRKMPIAHHWDDHDAGKNGIDKRYRFWDRSYQVFGEFIPTYELPSTPPGIWHKFSYAHVDFFVLDNRSQRDPRVDPDDINKSMLDGNNLGPSGQLEWLQQGLLSSSARWKIIFSSVVINPTGEGLDRWAGYQTEWQTLRSFIETNQISGIIFISGDLHSGGIDNGIAAGFPEMLVPTADGKSVGGGCATGDEGEWSEGIYSSPGPCMGYGVVTVLTDPDGVLLEVKDQDGNIRISFTVP